MKQNQTSALWHRCGTCGTIFISIQELNAHLATHKTLRAHWRRASNVAPKLQPLATPKEPAIAPEKPA
jgi:hypothetical protein